MLIGVDATSLVDGTRPLPGRRIAASVKLSTAWGVVWAIGEVLTHSVTYFTLARLEWMPTHDAFFNYRFLTVLVMEFILGCIAGLAFSLLLTTLERHHHNTRILSLPRAAIWGAIAGVVLAVIPTVVIRLVMPVPADELIKLFLRESIHFAVFSSICATVTVLLGRYGAPNSSDVDSSSVA
jgi:hypothetical protein